MPTVKMEFSAGGIVYKHEGERILYALIYNSYDQWTFPKGHIEKPEKPEESALREVSEEIGLTDIKIVQKIDRINYWFKMDGVLSHKYVYFFLMEAPAGTTLKAQTAEIKDAQWFNEEEVSVNLKYKEDIQLFKKAVIQLNTK